MGIDVSLGSKGGSIAVVDFGLDGGELFVFGRLGSRSGSVA